MIGQKEINYDFRPTGFPELDAINGLISLAAKYAQNGDLEKSRELASKAGAALDKITKTVLKNNVKQQ